ncbi:MAG TPA: phosphatase PAP2 family protein [Polyangiaceae bacterium]|nr:MAG: PAP2 superfamily protein [Deltaproteobacteria bacterium ADurb.Bin207]HNS96270.1 phosphatase PAP2 family protein [Polyangiaceae bacterium]HNZ20722.1 phosphatase PAP2 family protein [Polyangiaceae bacterium]HOD20663.1 phosphatase PAP2 family protein [Polyangiaceae bacterium]HOE49139.1 phosphatase PAP2 family protein [Polyangiaceae bacterium]
MGIWRKGVVWVALGWVIPGQALADDSPWRVHYGREAALTGVFVAGSLAFSTLEVDTTTRWKHELIPWDESVRGRHSAGASARSDMLAALTVAAPVMAVVGDGMNESAAHRGMIYAESLSVTLLLQSAAKYLVQRPRPYVYSSELRGRDSDDKDSHLSFFSGHSAMVFTAAVAGSFLFGVQSHDEVSRATLWGAELTMASATANLRVRAGKHYFSDVIVGSVVGAAVGASLPRLYLDNVNSYRPSEVEVGAMVGGVVVGTASAWLIPVPQDVSMDCAGMYWMPMGLPTGLGWSVVGIF